MEEARNPDDITSSSIIEYVRKGISGNRIAELEGMPLNQVYYRVRGITGKSFIEVKNESLREELELVRQQLKHFFEVRVMFDLSPSRFYHKVVKTIGGDAFFNEKRIDETQFQEMKESLASCSNPLIDLLVDSGLSFKDIATYTGFTKQYVEMYIKGSGQYTYWDQRSRTLIQCQQDGSVSGLKFNRRNFHHQ